MKYYKIFFEGNLIKVYKYCRCMLKYIDHLRRIEATRTKFFGVSDHMTDYIYIVDNMGQIMFV